MDWSEVLTAGGFFESATTFWLTLCIVLLILEVFTSGFFLGALAVSAALAAGIAALGWSNETQVIGFSVVSIASLIWARPLFMSAFGPEDLPTNAEKLVGATGTVTHQVPVGGIGRVRLTNEDWRATASEQLEIGQAVKVVKVEGNTLDVRRA